VFTGKPTTRPQSHDIEKLWWALVFSPRSVVLVPGIPSG
jgi:hypothetical protein